MFKSWWHSQMKRRKVKAANRARQTRLNLESLETRDTPAGIIAVASAPGAASLITVYDATTKLQKLTISPFGEFPGSPKIAVGDVNGDGTPDIIATPGPGGGPIVNVYDGTDGKLLKSFLAGDVNSRGGASVAAADFNHDGLADLVVGSIQGGQPIVQVLNFADLSILQSDSPFAGASSVSVAAGDVNDDGTPDVIVGSGSGIANAVTVFSGKNGAVIQGFNPFESSFIGGLNVAAGDVNGDGHADIFVAASVDGGPRVSVFDGTNGKVINNFFAYDSNQRDGAFTAAADVNSDSKLDIATTDGPNQSANPLAFSSPDLTPLTMTYPGLPVGTPYDTASPTVTLSTTAVSPTKVTPLPFTATFSEAVNGFTSSGITVTNGTVGNFVKSDAKTYTFDVTPTADGDVAVSVAAGAASDAAGNPNAASTTSTVTFDSTPPTVAANALATNDTTPTVTGTVGSSTDTVSVVIDGQTIAGTVTGTNWSATVPVALAPNSYTIQATATDAAGNTATASANLVVDTTAPTAVVASSASDPTGVVPIPFTITFSEPVTGFSANGLTVTNGTAGQFAGSGSSYTVDVTPTAAGSVSVGVDASAATDAAGNANAPSSVFSIGYSTGAIGLTADALTTNSTTPTLTGTVDDPTASVTVTVDGHAIAATVTGNDWSAAVTTALTEGTYDIQVSASNSVPATGSLTRTGGLVVDTTAPTVALATTTTSPTKDSPVSYTATFSEAVSGFDANGVTATNGTVSNVAGSGTTYTFDVTPTGQGTVTIAVKAGAANDPAGNANAASSPATFLFDSVAPTVTADSQTTSDTKPTLTGTVDDSTATVKVTVNGQTIDATVTGTTWSAAVPTALAPGTYDITVDGTDAAGNIGTTTLTGGLVINS